MKIGHFMPGIWHEGGIATYIRALSEEQKKFGNEVTFFDTVPGTEGSTIYCSSAVHVFLRAKQKGIDVLHVHQTLYDEPPPDLAVVRTVHGHQPYCPSASQFLRSKATPCHRFVGAGCIRGVLAERCGSVRPNRIWESYKAVSAEKNILKRIQSVAVSKFVRDKMILAGHPAERISHLELMSPQFETIQAMHDTIPRFVFLGRLTVQKGVSWLLDAVSMIKSEIRVDIAGAGPEQASLQAQVLRLGLSRVVTFHGWLAAAKIQELIARSRALIFPSLWHEPAGFVALEAMSNGRPVIGSMVGGIPETVLHERNGLLVEAGNAQQLMLAIERLASDIKLARQLGDAGRSDVSHRTARWHWERLSSVYSKAITEARSAA